jgi:hypothetical protein
MSPLPNFFLVGAPKAGTTAFLRYLEQHPAVFVSPIKEPAFFAPEILDMQGVRERVSRDREALQRYLDRPVLERRESGIVLEWEQYLKLFKGVRQETAIGEGSVSYLASPGAAAAIRSCLPAARILMILRDPADRLRSSWGALLAAGATSRGFSDWLSAQVERERILAPTLGPVGTGFYAGQVQRYYDTFPAKQIKIILYDDYVRNPQAALREVSAFLGVDRGWACDLTRRHNVNLVPKWPQLHRLARPIRRAVRFVLPGSLVTALHDRWYRPFRPAIAPDERAKAVAVYSDDIRSLAKLIERDLSSWLDSMQPSCCADKSGESPSTGR